MEKPLVSIVMGVYNEEKTIRLCLNSILNQTYTNWEFIICNDCSTDATLAILKEYHKRDSRFIIINNKQNLKLAASLNRCLKIAKGKYIARMDADDESLPDRLSKQVTFLEKHPRIDCVGCNRIIFDENGDIGIRKSVEYPNKKTILKDSPFAHPTILMKKTVYDLLGGYNPSVVRAQDLELWFRFYEYGFSGYNMQEVLYRYHESEKDLKKRTIKTGIQASSILLRGYKRINVPIYQRIWAIKPIISVIVPDKLLNIYHHKMLGDKQNVSKK